MSNLPSNSNQPPSSSLSNIRGAEKSRSATKRYAKASKALSAMLVYCLIICGQTPAQFLKVAASGIHITNGQDSSFIIRGVGLGGYMLQEGYMFHLGFLGTQTKIKGKIEEMVGKANTARFYEDWHKDFIQKADIDSMAAWGFNAIRLPMHYNLFTLPIQKEPVSGQNTWLPEGFRLVDSLLSWCSQAHIYLILDLHAAPGGQGNDLAISDRDPVLPSLWQSEANQDKTVALWERLAIRYKDAPYIGGYDLLNETNWGFTDSTDSRGTKERSNQPLWNLLKRVTAAIRKHDPRHMIILEGNGFANNYHGLDSLWDKNMVLSFHKYGNFNNQQSIQSFLDLRERLHAAIWLGESGENSNNWYTHCIQLMEAHQIGWSWWPWKKMGLNNPLEIKSPDNYQQFIRFAAGKGPKPDSTTGKKILQELLQNIQIQHNLIHRDVIDAMFKSVQRPGATPFTAYTVGDHPCYMLAADYNLGGNRYGYLDKDTARYQYTPGVHTEGNKGHRYRNDGVDIKYDTASGKPFVFSIEDGEWLAYLPNITRTGKYQLQLDYANDSKETSSTPISITLFQGNKKVGNITIDPKRYAENFTISQPIDITLSANTSPHSSPGAIKLQFNRGGILLRGMIIKPL